MIDPFASPLPPRQKRTDRRRQVVQMIHLGCYRCTWTGFSKWPLATEFRCPNCGQASAGFSAGVVGGRPGVLDRKPRLR